MPLAWPVSVPPVMVTSQAQARLSVMAPLMVSSRTWSKEVQVGLLRSEQPPEEVHFMPAARSLEVAWEWVSFLAEVVEARRVARRAVVRVVNWGVLVGVG